MSKKQLPNSSVSVLARGSPLSRAQIQEVMQHLPNRFFTPTYVKTTGDKDQLTSLKTLYKTDFFTKEIDERLLQGEGDIAIHAAKDLPELILEGLIVVALTKGLDKRDTLVFRKGESMPTNGTVGTSSEKREEAVRKLFPHARFTDIRGSIATRLAQVEQNKIDGVVVAEAALIRLGLTHLNRIYLPGPTTPHQGQLAILTRDGNWDMINLFSPLDTRRGSLHLGLRAPAQTLNKRIVHAPLIQTKTLPPTHPEIRHAFLKWDQATHLLFTSQTAVDCYCELIRHFALPLQGGKHVLCVGKKTAEHAKKRGFTALHIAQNESSEGVVALLQQLQLCQATLFWPHSNLSRSVIKEYTQRANISLIECPIYLTHPKKAPQGLQLDQFDEIHFTSPSTVDAFFSQLTLPSPPPTLHPIGPTTAKALEKIAPFPLH